MFINPAMSKPRRPAAVRLQRFVRFPISEAPSAQASHRQPVTALSGEAIRQPSAPDPSVVSQLPMTPAADDAERPVMIRCPRDQMPGTERCRPRFLGALEMLNAHFVLSVSGKPNDQAERPPLETGSRCVR